MRTVLLDHARAIGGCGQVLRLQVQFDLSDFRLTVQGRNRYVELVPQFVSVRDAAIDIFPEPGERVGGFAGWLPQCSWRPEAASDKLVFKRICNERGLATPPYWTRMDGSTRDFLIKPRRSASGHAIRGPFRAPDAKAAGRLLEDEYCEHFVPGNMARAWYWGEKLVCLEMSKMPTVTGDGVRSLRELAAERVKGSTSMLPSGSLDALALYQSRPLDAALPAGKVVIVDFRYASKWARAPLRNQRDKYADTAIGRQLADAGRALWSGAKDGALWTLDATVDEQAQQVSLLEMTACPVMHPDAYYAMLEGMFDAPDAPPPHHTPHGGPRHAAPGIAPLAYGPGAAPSP